MVKPVLVLSSIVKYCFVSSNTTDDRFFAEKYRGDEVNEQFDEGSRNSRDNEGIVTGNDEGCENGGLAYDQS